MIYRRGDLEYADGMIHARRSLLVATSLLAFGAGAPGTAADAQTVVMRRVIEHAPAARTPGGDGQVQTPTPTSSPTPKPTPAPAPAPAPAPTPTPLETGAWTVSAPTSSGPACSDEAPAVRQVWCALPDGTRVADARCLGQKPATDVVVADYRTCSYQWTTSDWSTESRGVSCGPYIQFREVYCRRSDGQMTSSTDNDCDQATRPDREQTAYEYAGCTFAWTSSDWSAPSTTCGDALQTRTTSCQRSDGTAVDDGACAAAGARPATSQNSHQVYGCTTSWQPGAWTTAPACGATVRTRSVSCLLSDGSTVGDDACAGQARPADSMATTDYSACTYAWTVSRGEWASACSDSTTRPVASSCQRSDGTAADASLCAAAARPAPSETGANYAGCTYAWTPSYGAWSSTCSASATRAVTYSCTRSTATPAPVDDVFCGGVSKGATSQTQAVLDSCTFKGTYSYGACTNGSKAGTLSGCTATAKDGTQFAVANSYCPTQTTPLNCASVVVNGDFSGGLSSWTIDTGTATAGTVPSGTTGAILTMDTAGSAIRQTFATVVGTTYQMDGYAYVMANSKGAYANTNAQIQVVDAAANSSYFNLYMGIGTGNSPLHMAQTFVAKSAKTTIYLSGSFIGNGYPTRIGFDNVSVSAK
jgi:hypothetical protein